MKLACVGIKWDWMWKPKVVHYAGGGHFGYDLGQQYVKIMVQRILFNTLADFETFASNLRSWQDAGTISLKLLYDGTNAAKLDGTNTTFPVLCLGFKAAEKVAAAAGTVYAINQVVFEQKGVAS